MSKQQTSRRPATKFPHLQKKLQKQASPPKTRHDQKKRAHRAVR